MVQLTEHGQKYETLAQRLGVASLVQIVLGRVTPERIQQALAVGDEYLNTITLSTWDEMAVGETRTKAHRCGKCGQTVPARDSRYSSDWPFGVLNRTQRELPWSNAKGLSLSDRVCVLKHVAKFHLTGEATKQVNTPAAGG